VSNHSRRVLTKVGMTRRTYGFKKGGYDVEKKEC